MYVGAGHRVFVFRAEGRNPRPIGRIVGFKYVYGLAVDRDRELYACDEGGHRLLAFRPGTTAPYVTYDTGCLYVAVYNERVVAGTRGHRIVEFRKGYSRPRRFVPALGPEVDGLAFDSFGNLFAAYRRSDGPGDAGIESFAPGATTGTDLGVSLTAPQGLAVDAVGDILVAETEGVNRIDVFRPGATMPFRRHHLSAPPTELQLSANDEKLYASALSSRVYWAAYPRLRLRVEERRPVIDDVQGVAVSRP
jgi:hypothetical protein